MINRTQSGMKVSPHLLLLSLLFSLLGCGVVKHVCSLLDYFYVVAGLVVSSILVILFPRSDGLIDHV